MRALAAVPLLCLLLAGCGALELPPQGGGGSSNGGEGSTRGGEVTTARGTAPPAPARGPTLRGQAALLRAGLKPYPHVRRGDPWASPIAGQVLIAFATEYINWNAHTVAADMRLLASQSIGQAHSAMELAAGETARDYELQRGGIANSGIVEGAAPLDGPGRRWVVVTKERTTSTNSSTYQGLAPEWHVIVAGVVQIGPRHWAINYWQPMS